MVNAAPEESSLPGGPTADDEAAALQDSLLELSRLGAGRLGLGELLTRVAGYAVQAIPGADGAGLTLLEEDRQDTIVATVGLSVRSTTSSTASGKAPVLRPPGTGRR